MTTKQRSFVDLPGTIDSSFLSVFWEQRLSLLVVYPIAPPQHSNTHLYRPRRRTMHSQDNHWGPCQLRSIPRYSRFRVAGRNTSRWAFLQNEPVRTHTSLAISKSWDTVSSSSHSVQPWTAQLYAVRHSHEISLAMIVTAFFDWNCMIRILATKRYHKLSNTDAGNVTIIHTCVEMI